MLGVRGSKLGFLYNGFEEKFYFWESVVMARKVSPDHHTVQSTCHHITIHITIHFTIHITIRATMSPCHDGMGLKVLLSVVVVFIKPVGTLTQAVFAIVILFIAYSLQIAYQPYLDDELMDRIEVRSPLYSYGLSTYGANSYGLYNCGPYSGLIPTT